jgi:hypothetical protein
MKILNDLYVDGHIKQNTPYDLDTDLLTCRRVHLSAAEFGGPLIVLENALNLSNDSISRQWEGAGQIDFRRRFGDSIPADKDRMGTISFQGWTGTAGIARPNPDPRFGQGTYSNWRTCAAIFADCVGTPVLRDPRLPGELVFATAPNITHAGPRERMRITSDGNIGIGTNKPEARLHVAGSIVVNNNQQIFGKSKEGVREICLIPRNSGDNTILRYGTGGVGLSIQTVDGKQSLNIGNNRYVTMRNGLRIEWEQPVGSWALRVLGPVSTTDYMFAPLWFESNQFYVGPNWNLNNPYLTKSGDHSLELTTVTNNADIRFYTRGGFLRMTVRENGRVGINTANPNATLEVAGTIAKRSSTFLIDHPLDPTNKDLFHGMVEAPRYDLIYRGVVKLNNGTAIVNIDEASNMSNGTFAALTQNAEVTGLVNKTSFSRLKPSDVVDGKFTIECEDNYSQDTVSWLVVAERHDPFIINNTTTRTDENGHLIPEWEKPTI